MKMMYLTFLALAALLLFTQVPYLNQSLYSDKDIIQDAMNGCFNNIGLPSPKTIVPCIDDDSAQKTVAFTPVVLDKACHMTITSINDLVNFVKDFSKSLNPQVAVCLKGNAEVAALQAKLGTIDESKIAAYIVSHFFAVRSEICNIQKTWSSSNYNLAGQQMMALLKKILGISLTKKQLYLQLVSNKQIIQEYNNGLFVKAGLPKPTTVVACYDDVSAANQIVFLDGLLEKTCNLSVLNMLSLKSFAQAYKDSIPAQIASCLKGNNELIKLNSLAPDVTSTQLISYVTANLSAFKAASCDIKAKWVAKDYAGAGALAYVLRTKIK